VDPTGRYQIRQLIQRLGDEGKTVFVSSHILLELGEVCDHVGIIEAGRLRGSGPLEQFLDASEAGRLLRMRLLTSDAGRAATLLGELGAVLEASGAATSLEVRIPDDDNVHAEVLARLAAAGFRIGHLVEEKASLEEVYRRMTKGELA
jgi:ABC-2 type transport system ATP-binding protein